MTPNQFRAAIQKLSLSQERAGLFLGRSARQGQRWANGEAPIPKAEAMLLHVMVRKGLKPKEVERPLNGRRNGARR